MARTINHYFWIGRQLERIYNIATLIKVHRAFLIDERQKGTENWFELLISMGEKEKFVEIYGDESKKYGKLIQYYLIWENKNPMSLKNIIQLAKNNAESIQSRFSSLSFESVNNLYMWLNDEQTKELYNRNNEAFLEELILSVYHLFGIIENNMVRETNYYYYRLGRMLEGVIQTARVLDFAYQEKMDQEKMDQEKPKSDLDKSSGLFWLYVLKFCSSDELFLSSVEMVPNDKNSGDFLLCCKKAPRSILYYVRTALECFNHIVSERPPQKREQAHELLIQLVAHLENLTANSTDEINYKTESVRVLNKAHDISDKIEKDFCMDKTESLKIIQQKQPEQ